ncbi:thioesterase domain-containing protein [Devosia sp. XJ19-1]|uniref:Thioesterase domain-containing protein n=1 Tax=Devosia ureilytica TaxID=2952754 RepID=A0A9Q4ALC5_9HYPH|nr:YiiD C-terminal domain-containing protein [Devosia ureilytica]MCP8882392.1 thioesterase domain-containing protein [Devosia ureilytica]MCP8885721.1 thioesterase domain-containing protein [Devosia ureilytica]
MTPAALADFLHEHIPLSRAMNVTAVRASVEEVVLEAPLEPNINVHGTMFGGSAATLGLLAAWSVLHLRLEAEGISNQLVIHRTEMEYLKPIAGTAQAVARLEGADWASFLHTLDRRGKARLKVNAALVFNGEPAARLAGEFVAILER